ncbi:hypothetical protein [Flammeovirga sp. SubArs3]|uniref:hypothetical protein n=1 Tax=Flammeovirga sp. SubArs3 TaxID=2995316 RepID=UPI00248C2937|nr:hypothetical protein [Flammeovirga sp. SubArs3]
MAQNTSYKEKWVPAYGFIFDHEIIIPESIQVLTSSIKNIQPKITKTNKLIFIDYASKDTLSNDELIKIAYRTLPSSLKQTEHRSFETYQQGGYGINNYQDSYIQKVEKKNQKQELFYAPNIEKTGSLTRGLSMGNNQDVFVNSAMNLQLQGNITEDVRLTATLTDQDIPFQPEGNTQQIQDFDKVYIALEHKHAKVEAGDIVMKNDENTFLRYNKNVQGVQASIYTGNDSSKIQSSTKVGLSVAKGQFYSANIPPIDGVIGPYRLSGPNGETNIVIIANSERVFIDGQLLERGFDKDYTIDYNLSEITFTEKIVITQYSRIRIDYEYAVQYYSRSILEASNHIKGKNWETLFQYYQEKDDRNSSLFYSLSDEDKQILSSIGDSLQYAYAPSYDTVSFFDPNRVLYTKVDTVTANGSPAICFRLANSSDNSFYQVGFTDVGQGKGDYILDEVTAFGRVYQWVSPINGIPQGRYLPIRKLVAPNQKRMITMGGKLHLSTHEEIKIEGAFSHQDNNLFSDLNDEDDFGAAANIGIKSTDRVLNKNWKISSFAELMYLDENFKSIDRFRPIEFDRNWSIYYDSIPSSEEIYITSGFEIYQNKDRKIAYSIALRDKDSVVNGQQHNFQLKYNLNQLHFNTNAYLMNAQLLMSNEHSDWKKLSSEVFYKSPYITPGYQYNLDQQSTKVQATDSVATTWINYTEHFAYLKQGDSLHWNYQLGYKHREDKAPQNGELKIKTITDTYNFSIGQKGRKGNISTDITYRKWKDYFNTTPQNEESLQGRMNGSLKFGNGIGKFNGTYTVSSSRELEKEFVYIRVEDGKGTHTWRDLNGDGIKDLNEFFLAQNPDERQYARFYTPTDEYVPAYRSSLNLRLNLASPRKWKKLNGFRHLVSRFSNNSSILVEKKSTSDDISGRYLPFLSTTTTEDLLTYKYSLRNTLFFNRSNPIYGADFRVVILENQQLLTQGRENRQDQRYTLSGRVNLGRKVTCKLEGTQRNINSGSDYLDDRNYKITEQIATPIIAFQPSVFMRFNLSYSLKKKLGEENNSESIQQTSNIQEVAFEGKWSKAALFTISSKFSMIYQDYSGEENSALGYEMLDALSVGQNLKWNISLIQTLFNGLQLKVNYDWRKSNDNKSVHIGSMNLTALF